MWGWLCAPGSSPKSGQNLILLAQATPSPKTIIFPPPETRNETLCNTHTQIPHQRPHRPPFGAKPWVFEPQPGLFCQAGGEFAARVPPGLGAPFIFVGLPPLGLPPGTPSPAWPRTFGMETGGGGLLPLQITLWVNLAGAQRRFWRVPLPISPQRSRLRPSPAPPNFVSPPHCSPSMRSAAVSISMHLSRTESPVR